MGLGALRVHLRALEVGLGALGVDRRVLGLGLGALGADLRALASPGGHSDWRAAGYAHKITSLTSAGSSAASS